MSASPAWSPYGLEAHRVALLQRRSRLLAAGLALGLLLIGSFLANSIREGSQIDTVNGDGSRISLDNLNTDRPRAKPTTLSVAPGKTTVLNQPIQPEVRPNSPPGTPTLPEQAGLNWKALLTTLGPTLLGAAYAWHAGRKRILGGLEQVNLGVYKGALPFELHSAAHKRSIFTRQQAHRHLFGRRAADFLPAAPVVLGRARQAR